MEKVPATPSAIQTDKLSSSEKQIMIFSVSSWITEGELQTQRLQLKLQKYFTVQRQPIAVEMYSLSKVAEKAPAADLILLTPEAQFALKELQEAVPHTPILLLSSQEYGLLPIEQIAEKSLQSHALERSTKIERGTKVKTLLFHALNTSKRGESKLTPSEISRNTPKFEK